MVKLGNGNLARPLAWARARMAHLPKGTVRGLRSASWLALSGWLAFMGFEAASAGSREAWLRAHPPQAAHWRALFAGLESGTRARVVDLTSLEGHRWSRELPSLAEPSGSVWADATWGGGGSGASAGAPGRFVVFGQDGLELAFEVGTPGPGWAPWGVGWEAFERLEIALRGRVAKAPAGSSAKPRRTRAGSGTSALDPREVRY